MLFPEPRDLTVPEAYDGTHRVRQGLRPWVVLCMISSIDGSVAVNGNSAGLGGPLDRQIFLHLHRSADCVLVGGETVRQDGYSPLPAHQRLVVVSRSGNLGAKTAEHAQVPNTVIETGDVRDIVHRLPGSTCVLEGGPNLNAQMLDHGLVDEVCLTIAPQILTANSPRFSQGVATSIDLPVSTAAHSWSLAHLGQEDGFIFLRYLRSASPN